MPLSPAGLAFLREIGTTDVALEILQSEEEALITGDTLASFLRRAYDAGRHSARDVYRWHDIPALLGEPGAR